MKVLLNILVIMLPMYNFLLLFQVYLMTIIEFSEDHIYFSFLEALEVLVRSYVFHIQEVRI